MYFIDKIIERLDSASSSFYSAGQIVHNWVWPFNLLAAPLGYLQQAFSSLAYYAGSFNTWADAVVAWLSEVFSIDQIVAYLRTWLNMAELAWGWCWNSVANVTNIINDWWASAKSSALVLITNLESWAVGEINSLKQTVQSIISDIGSYVTPILNTFRDTILSLISDVENWTRAQINSISNTISALISDVRNWAAAQLNNARDFLTGLISDLSAWSVAQLNTLRDAITNLLDWASLWQWITSWWNDRLKDIQALFNSWLNEWSPFWEGWQDVKQDVITFLNDPLEWLWAKFADWFLGKE